MAQEPATAHKRPRPACRALVVACNPQRGAKGDVWNGKRWMVVALSCGHTVRKVGHRRYLIGEALVCVECQRAVDQAQPSLLDPAGPS